MSSNKHYQDDIAYVKEKIVNISLMVSSVVGFPLIIALFIRALKLESFHSPIAFTCIYLIVLIATLWHKQIQYKIKASIIIALIFAIAINDFLATGILSMGTLWLFTAVILIFLFYNFTSAIVSIVFFTIATTIITFLGKQEVGNRQLDLNLYSQLNEVLLLRILVFILVSGIIVFSIKQITDRLKSYIEQLKQKTDILTNATQRMQQEIDQRKKSDQLAKEREIILEKVFEKSSDAMAILNENGNFIRFNEAFVTVSEIEKDQILKINYLDIIPQAYKHYFSSIGEICNIPSHFDLKYRSGKSGKLRYFDVRTTCLQFSEGKLLLVVFRDETLKIAKERKTYTAALEAEEKERLRISKELHDGIGPLLSTLKIYFQALQQKENDPEINNRIAHILDESITHVKEISNNLSPYILENLGLNKAIQSFIDKLKFASININFDSNLEGRLEKNLEITLYRLISELINNTLKHAKASKIELMLKQNQKKLCLTYNDDGVGFDLEQTMSNDKGIGLFNIKSRIEKLGGDIKIASGINEGFQLKAELVI